MEQETAKQLLTKLNELTQIGNSLCASGAILALCMLVLWFKLDAIHAHVKHLPKGTKSKLEKAGKTTGLGTTIGVIAVLAVLLATISVTAFAANPADLTADFRAFPGYYSKVAYDAGPWYALQILPIGKESSLTLSRDGRTMLTDWL